MATVLAGLRADNLAAAAEIARLPETVRGFGPIKQRSAAAARLKQADLMKGYIVAPHRSEDAAVA